MSNNVGQWRCAYFVLAFVTVLVYALTFTISPMSGEDFALTKDFGNEGIFDRLSWVTERSLRQIVGWNARLGEQLAIFWLSVPKAYFTVASTFTFVAFNLLLSGLYSGLNEVKDKAAISIGLVFLFWPGMEVFFWGTANAGYLQPLLLSLVLIYLYRNEEAIKSFTKSKTLVVIALVVAVLAGLSFENVPIAILSYMILSFFSVKGKKGNFLALLPVAGIALGWFLLITAPSTAYRREFYKNAHNVTEYNVDYIVSRVLDVVDVFFSTSYLIFAAFIVSVVYVIGKSSEKPRALLMVLPAFIAVASVVASPYTEPRAFLLAWTLMLATIVEATFVMTKNIRRVHLLVTMAMLVSLGVQLKALLSYSEFSLRLNDRDAYIKGNLGTKACDDGVVVKPFTFNFSYKYVNSREDWYGGNPGWVSMYYGCKVLMR